MASFAAVASPALRASRLRCSTVPGRLVQKRIVGQRAMCTSSAQIPPTVYLGTMTFGWPQSSKPVDQATATEMIRRFTAAGGYRIDTARVYGDGKSEEMLGLALHTIAESPSPEVVKQVRLGTKANPSQENGLSFVGVRMQAAFSSMHVGLPPQPKEKMPPGARNFYGTLPELGPDWPLQEFFLHRPDPENSLVHALQACQELVEGGYVEEVGLSNYHPIEVARAHEICAHFGWRAPSVYQGLYNPLNRAVEDELLPMLREHNMRFVAYNPLAGGVLTGKHAGQAPANGDVVDAPQGRFKANSNYQTRFFTEPNFTALEAIARACDEAGVDMIEATYRWLLTGSALDPSKGDGFVLGASSLEQLDENLAACAAVRQDDYTPLPQSVQAAFDAAWGIVAATGNPFPYWRSFHSDLPNRDSLPQGAV